MIYTLTLNPSIDYIMKVPGFEKGKLNRAESTEILPGGKGLNVSIVLKNLGVESIALGFTAGTIGATYEAYVKNLGIDYDFVRVGSGDTRINVKAFSDIETEINAEGPSVSDSEMYMLYKRLDSIKSGDWLCLGGSIPQGVSTGVYREIMEKLMDRGIRFIVDTSGDNLVKTLPLRPFLIKPNDKELSEIFMTDIKTREQALEYGTKLHKMGAENVIVTLGAKGAVFIGSDNRTFSLDAPSGELVNSIGAGDSTVAGFIAGIKKYRDSETAFKYAVCAGSASAFSSSLATEAEVEKLMRQEGYL